MNVREVSPRRQKNSRYGRDVQFITRAIVLPDSPRLERTRFLFPLTLSISGTIGIGD